MKIKNAVSVVILCMSFAVHSLAQKNKVSCADWQSKVDDNKPLVLVDSENGSQEEIFFGVDCLLRLEGKKKPSNVSGASKGDVSNVFGDTSVEVAALYYVSYLFYRKWSHADAPFLTIQGNRKLNSEKAVSKAYQAYRKWFGKVREIGLEEARKQNLDPLGGSGVSWY